MSVKVETHGNQYLDPNNFYQVECEGCGTLFKFNGGDAHLNSNGSAVISCPDCKKQTFYPKWVEREPDPDEIANDNEEETGQEVVEPIDSGAEHAVSINDNPRDHVVVISVGDR